MNTTSQPSPNQAFIAHYKLGNIVGRGGMGLVYLAEDTRLNRRVAIKCLRTELFEPHYRERFRREALLLAKLNHPHIVHIYDYVETEDQLALVMEYIDGQNLQAHLRENIVPISQRMRWLVQIAQGLAIAHEAGIIHRDLKQENILINKLGLAKISDLGIAKSQDFNATLTDHVAGSYCSMSPEQAMGEPLSFKSDLFSFGILAYQLLCGSHPFGDMENKLQIMQRIISHPPVAPSKTNPDLPQPIADLLGQLLSKNPDNRPDSTQWVAAQLEQMSQLLNHEYAENDTLALSQSGQAQGATMGTTRHATRAKMTRDHATFDTRYQGRRAQDQNRAFIAQHWALLSLVLALVVAVTGISIWQMQPKPPKYVAVVPPIMTTEGMDESQQALIKNVVYDALQQGVLQLHGYFLIPREEIAAVSADGNAEQIWRATAADEVLSTNISCRRQTCNITLSRLVPDNNKIEARLLVRDTKSLEVLTDEYRTIAEFTQSNLGHVYSENLQNELANITDKEYEIYIQSYIDYQEKGASRSLLETLESLSTNTKNIAAVKTLYMSIIVDLFYESGDNSLLKKAQTSILESKNKSSTSYLYILHALQTAQNDLQGALNTLKELEKTNPNPSEIHKLRGYTMMIDNNYDAAIDHYKKSASIKNTASTNYGIALGYWYSGNYHLAEFFIKQALSLSPAHYKTHRLNGALSLVRGNPESAIESFNRIIRDDDIAVISNLGISYLLLKENQKAETQFRKALELAPEKMTLSLNLADALYLNGNKEDAFHIYQTIISAKDIHPTAETIRNQAQANAHLGNFHEAIIQTQELQKTDPQNVDTAYTSALVYAQAGEVTSSLINIEKALENKLHPIWFKFSWFDHLCNNQHFVDLMHAHGAPQRCTP